MLTQGIKRDIIIKNSNKRNQLTVEDVGSFMLFRGNFYG